MPYCFDFSQELSGELRRVGREQLTQALAELEAFPPAHAIHRVRKRCKKLRGLLRIVRPGLPDTYAFENAFFRDAANGLSDLRDATVLIQTYDKLLDAFADDFARRPFGPIRRHLTECHERIDGDDAKGKIQLFRDSLQVSLSRVERWAIQGDPAEAILAGEQQTYRRGCAAFADALASDASEDFHKWRKCVKYHGFHTQLLGELREPALKTRLRELDSLGDLLGDDHDLAVLRFTIFGAPETFGSSDQLAPFLALIIRRQRQLRRKARRLGSRLHSEKPRQRKRRLSDLLDRAIGR